MRLVARAAVVLALLVVAWPLDLWRFLLLVVAVLLLAGPLS